MKQDDFVRHVEEASREWFSDVSLHSIRDQRGQRVYQFLMLPKSGHPSPDFVVDTFIRTIREEVREFRLPFFVSNHSRGEKQADGSYKVTFILSGIPPGEDINMTPRRSRFEHQVNRLFYQMRRS